MLIMALAIKWQLKDVVSGSLVLFQGGSVLKADDPKFRSTYLLIEIRAHNNIHHKLLQKIKFEKINCIDTAENEGKPTCKLIKYYYVVFLT